MSSVNIADEASFLEACSSLRNKGVNTLFVALGEKRVFVFNDEYKELVPAYKAQSIDTTAADDCFFGAFGRSLPKKEEVLL